MVAHHASLGAYGSLSVRGRRAASAGVAELARLDASRRHTAGEAAARHGTAGRSGEDDETTEPRA